MSLAHSKIEAIIPQQALSAAALAKQTSFPGSWGKTQLSAFEKLLLIKVCEFWLVCAL